MKPKLKAILIQNKLENFDNSINKQSEHRSQQKRHLSIALFYIYSASQKGRNMGKHRVYETKVITLKEIKHTLKTFKKESN